MALVFAKNSGLNDDLWKVKDQIIRAVLQDTDNEKNDDDELVSALYNVEKSDKFGEKISSMTEMGNFAIVDEGDAGIQDEIQQGFSKLIQHYQFMKGFTCTAEMNEDGDINSMKVAAANALANLITQDELSADYILPKAFDPRVKDAVAAAVAEAARKSGVARI